MRTRLVAILSAAALAGLSATITTSGASAGGVCTSVDGDAPVIHGGGPEVPACTSLFEGDTAFAAGRGTEALAADGSATAVGNGNYVDVGGGDALAAGSGNTVVAGPYSTGIATGSGNEVNTTKGGEAVARGRDNTAGAVATDGFGAIATGRSNDVWAAVGLALTRGLGNDANAILCTAVAIGHEQSDSCDES